MQSEQRELRLTADGSSTIFIPAFNEPYHSMHGAVQESLHVFLKNGFERVLREKTQINILEIGMGTGLNVLLTMAAGREKNIRVHYTALEPYPLAAEIISGLNYTSIPETGIQTHWLHDIHAAPWEIFCEPEPGFFLRKCKITLENAHFENTFDLVYFDAFGPAVQPEIWSAGNFKKLFHALHAHGILVTYASRGSVRRAMQDAGFSVQKVPGPRGKREISIAEKIQED